MNDEGNLIVIWETYSQDGSQTGVFAKQYDSAGVPLGPEFRVNTHTAGNQGYPSVAMLSGDEFVAAWTDFNTADGNRNADAYYAGVFMSAPKSLAPMGYATAGEVRSVDGVIGVPAVDFSTSGFGVQRGQSRIWSNDEAYSSALSVGNGWSVSELPFLVADGQAVRVVSGTDQFVFDRYFVLGVPYYRARFFVKDTLTYNSGSDEFTLYRTDGSRIVFSGFQTPSVYRKGQFSKLIDPAGNETKVTQWSALGQIEAIQRRAEAGGIGQYEAYLYNWQPSEDGKQRLEQVILKRLDSNIPGAQPPSPYGSEWTQIRKVNYTYYGSQSPNGTVGDLEFAKWSSPRKTDSELRVIGVVTLRNRPASGSPASSGVSPGCTKSRCTRRCWPAPARG